MPDLTATVPLPTTITVLIERVRVLTQNVNSMHHTARLFIDSIQGLDPTPPNTLGGGDGAKIMSVSKITPTLNDAVEELSHELHRLQDQFNRVNVRGFEGSAAQDMRRVVG